MEELVINPVFSANYNLYESIQQRLLTDIIFTQIGIINVWWLQLICQMWDNSHTVCRSMFNVQISHIKLFRSVMCPMTDELAFWQLSGGIEIKLHSIHNPHTHTYTDIRRHTPTYADIRIHTQTYADIRKHMQTYADMVLHVASDLFREKRFCVVFSLDSPGIHTSYDLFFSPKSLEWSLGWLLNKHLTKTFCILLSPTAYIIQYLMVCP